MEKNLNSKPYKTSKFFNIMSNAPKDIKQIEEAVWEIPTSYKEGMLVPARIIATKKLLDAMDPGVFDQVTNLACLPGIQKYAICMPDGHWGYGSPIGGVAAMDSETGVISPGIVGFDVNCGMKMVVTNLTIKEVRPRIRELVDTLYKAVPSGVGSKGFVKLNNKQFNEVVEEGVKWCVDNGYGWKEDLERIESNGKIEWADHTKVSQKARQRGIDQLGTLGSGNHYLEIQHVKSENILDEKLAKKFGIFKDQIVIMFHCLPGNSKVLTEHGFTMNIKDLDRKKEVLGVKFMNKNSKIEQNTDITDFFELDPHGKIYKLKTETGKEIIGTDDHPIMTPRGLEFISYISLNDKVAVMPFEGIDYEEPNDKIIISEEDIKKVENN